MSDEAIDESNALVVSNSSLYSKDIDAGQKVGMIVASLTDEIEGVMVGQKIRFKDTAVVRQTVLRYLRSCERTGAIPSKIGLARACGCDRHSLDKFMREHPEHDTAQFLRICIDAFAEALSQASLNGSVQPIVAIFLQKALYGVRENEQVVPPPDNPLGPVTETEDLAKKYPELLQANNGQDG